MLFSTATGYALRALAAMPEDGSYSLAKDLASKAAAPAMYPSTITAQPLVAHTRTAQNSVPPC